MNTLAYLLPTTHEMYLYLPNAEMTLDLEANEVEVKVLTSLASVTGSTDPFKPRLPSDRWAWYTQDPGTRI
jgi:hypothetical protein